MLTLDFLKVGNADATLVRYEGDGAFTMLVDCADAKDGGDKRVTDFLERNGVSALDLLVITHLHADHTGGLGRVAEALPVKTLWTNYLPPAGATLAGLPERAVQLLPRGMDAYLAALDALRAKGTELIEIGPEGRGETLCGGLCCDVYGPGADVYARQNRYVGEALTGRPETSELFFFRGLINVTSLRLALRTGASRAVLAGDLYGHLFTRGERVPCTLLRAPHHGSDASMDEETMAALSPDVTVVSAEGGIKTDRPAPEMLALLKRHSGRVLVTGEAEGESIHIELP